MEGPLPPGGPPPNPRLVLVRQPEDARSYGEAYQFAVERATAEEIILLNDDAVLLPTTVPVLLEDVELLRRHRPPVRPGFVACRSNFAPGAQNIRSPNGGTLRGGLVRWTTEQSILAAERVSPIAAWIERRALREIGGFPPINWFSDDLMCFDLSRRGYTHFVSRAYVHHVGMRATTEDGTTPRDLLEEGLAWVRRHRPDFLAVLEARARADGKGQAPGAAGNPATPPGPAEPATAGDPSPPAGAAAPRQPAAQGDQPSSPDSPKKLPRY